MGQLKGNKAPLASASRVDELPSSPDIEKALAGLAEVLNLVISSIGVVNSSLQRIANGEALSEEDAEVFAQMEETLQTAWTLLGRVREFVSPEMLLSRSVKRSSSRCR